MVVQDLFGGSARSEALQEVVTVGAPLFGCSVSALARYAGGTKDSEVGVNHRRELAELVTDNEVDGVGKRKRRIARVRSAVVCENSELRSVSRSP